MVKKCIRMQFLCNFIASFFQPSQGPFLIFTEMLHAKQTWCVILSEDQKCSLVSEKYFFLVAIIWSKISIWLRCKIQMMRWHVKKIWEFYGKSWFCKKSLCLILWLIWQQHAFSYKSSDGIQWPKTKDFFLEIRKLQNFESLSFTNFSLEHPVLLQNGMNSFFVSKQKSHHCNRNFKFESWVDPPGGIGIV